MLTSTLPLRKFLDTFVPGFILQMGIWFLYRPYLLKYFPNFEFHDSNQNFSAEVNLIVFLMLAISLGMIINHMSDIAVKLNYMSKNHQRRTFNLLERMAKYFFFVFTFGHNKDERIETIKRYLSSGRKDTFLKMCSDWAWTDENKMSNAKEIITVHQHICSRIRIVSKQSEAIYEGLFAEVAFVSSLFTTFFLLFMGSLLSIPINYFSTSGKLKHFDLSVILPFLALTYIFCVLFNYSLRRRFRNFCSQAMTIALHIYSQSETDKQDETEPEAEKSIKLI